MEVQQSGSVETQCVHFYIKEGFFISTAELSMIDESTWEFNRLLVHRTMRGNGYASLLVDKVVDFCKKHSFNLQCGINPYGDMDLHQLRDFYIRHGFKETEHEDFLELRFHDEGDQEFKED